MVRPNPPDAPLPLTDDEVAGWLRISTTRGLPAVALHALLRAFGAPHEVFAQPFATLAKAAGTVAAQAALAPPAADFDAQVAALRVWGEQPGHNIVPLGDPAYPPRLLELPDPPPLLYIKGRCELLHARAVAIVGSRNATPQGREDAQRFAGALAQAGVGVVSGLALGVDGAAHRGALREAGGTAAVIGTGADVVYPAAHRTLAADIAAHGAILSEWPLGTPPLAAHFPQRNRLIAALVEGVLVVEAARRSGSLITARLANDMGRDVFALPGSIHAPLSRGCHHLLKQGAQLVETPDEILEELRIAAPARSPGSRSGVPQTAESPRRRPLAEQARRLLAALGHAPATLEILCERTDMAEAALQAALLELELAGHLHALPGGRFIRAPDR